MVPITLVVNTGLTGETPLLKSLLRKRLVSAVSIGCWVLVGRYGTNKTTLRNILKKELKKRGM